MYTLLLYVHVVAVIGWLGAGLTFSIMNGRVATSRDAAQIQFMANQGEWFGSRFFSTAAVVTLLSGIGMVVSSDALSFGDLWITGGFVGIAASLLIGAVLINRATNDLTEVVASDGVGPRTAAVQRRLATLGAIDLLILFSVVALMVWKP